MAYYTAGDYYRAGDYYHAGGLGGFLGGIVKKVGGAIIGATPVGRAIKIGAGIIRRAQTPPQIAPPAFGAGMTFGAPGARAAAAGRGGEQVVVGRARNVLINGKRFHYNKYGELKKGRIPIMNPLNPRALARSSRRIDKMRAGMGKALKHTNYKLVSKSAGRGKGSRGVITRSEAARALRG